MNLAKFFVTVFWIACGFSPAPTQSSAPVTSSGSHAAASQDSEPQSANQESASSPAAQSSSAKTQKTDPKPRKHKRKKAADTPKCESNAASAQTAGNASAKAAGTNPPAQANCPPSKTVIQNGGTSEPAVQITGGEGAAQAQQKSTTDQLLGSTEDNLKKIAGRQLTSAQEDMVSQVRQYVAQSKEAVTAGDAERGRMLAQKAQLLSDELVKPQE
jgi:hypothetical protein